MERQADNKRAQREAEIRKGATLSSCCHPSLH